MRPGFIILLAYLLGSIPFGYLIVRLKHGADIRETGSGGTGATNVSRRAGKFAGIVTLLLDALKGAAAVLLAQRLLPNEGSEWWIAAAAVAALLGHIFPVWLKFRGGKGVATGVGVFLVLLPVLMAIAAIVFLSIVIFTRYVSLGSISAAVAVPLLLTLQHLIFGNVRDFYPLLTVALVGSALITWAHRQNIGRLMSGVEGKFR